MKKALLGTAFLLMLPVSAVVMAPTSARASSDTPATAETMAAEELACAAEDVAKGKKVYKKCAACHVVNKEKNKVGPHLVNLFGRKAGAVEKYRYSKAMKKAAEDGLVWNVKTLDTFLEKPKKMIPKTKMSFRGIKKEKQRNALLCYIKSVNG